MGFGPLPSFIAAFSEFTRSTPSLTAEPTIDDSFIVNQMVHNLKRFKKLSQRCNMIANLVAVDDCPRLRYPAPRDLIASMCSFSSPYGFGAVVL